MICSFLVFLYNTDLDLSIIHIQGDTWPDKKSPEEPLDPLGPGGKICCSFQTLEAPPITVDAMRGCVPAVV